MARRPSRFDLAGTVEHRGDRREPLRGCAALPEVCRLLLASTAAISQRPHRLVQSDMAQLESWMHWLVEFMRANQEWAVPIVFLVAFCECIAFLSWLVPATVFFTAFGAVA